QMTQTRTDLKALQELDSRIEHARQRVQDFDPQFAEVEEPALALEGEVTTTRNRLQEMKLEERRLELSTEEKRARLKRLEERMGAVRTLREEAAVSAELDMVRRALQSDEQEAYTLIDQIRKLDERLAGLQESWNEAREQVEPRMKELVAERDEAKESLASLERERSSFADQMDSDELRLYEAIRSGGRRRAVSVLTEDGACGNCFGVVPLQLQNEIRHGNSLIRCQGCGVILASPEEGGPAKAADAERAPVVQDDPDGVKPEA
ncbi:MAG TPA: hypothetical protein VK849_03845, partial [Longimicrobiales bacterium]|nr:hypothetical protein [Longimicrobiales bacterium]